MGKNLTIRLEPDAIRKAKVLAARRTISVSHLVAQHIEELAAGEEAYARAERHALALLDRPLHLGSRRTDRAELHER